MLISREPGSGNMRSSDELSQEQLFICLQELDEQSRDMLLLFRFEGFKCADLEVLYGCDIEEVKDRLQTALVILTRAGYA